MIKIGYMEYANVYPIFHYLLDDEFCEFTRGFPADLNKLVRQGAIDLSPASSIEYARNFEKYLILPDISISSIGAVKSVNIFSDYPIGELSGKKVYFTKESNTSTVLARIVLEKFHKVQPIYTNIEVEADAKLLIGDKALYEYYNSSKSIIIDLGEEWLKFTKLPFVFALWIANIETIDSKEFHDFTSRFKDICSVSKSDCHKFVEKYVEKGYKVDEILDYWNTIDYHLSAKHIEGLKLFYKYAYELGETKNNPELNFYKK